MSTKNIYFQHIINTATRKEFREIITEIAIFLCYEAMKDAKLKEVEIETPLCKTKAKVLEENNYAFVPILRAGTGMLDGLLQVIPNAKIGHIGLYRNEETLKPVKYYYKVPKDIANRTVILLDPMLATGGSAIDAISMLKEDGVKSSIAKFLTDDVTENIIKTMGAETGDAILIVADKNSVVFQSLGALRLELAKQFDLIKDKNEFNFTWITEFPLFEYNEEEDRYHAAHHPFTSPMDEDLDMLESNPGAVRSKAYDLVLNGEELGGGSIRIHDSAVQERMLKALGFTEERAWESFGFLLQALKFGAPPHGGLAFGLDRMVMFLAGTENIKDVIAFPKNQNAFCYLSEAPNVVDEKQIDELGLIITKKEEE